MVLGNEKKIDDRQFGFRKQRSTIDALSKLAIKSSMDLEEKRKQLQSSLTSRVYDKINRNKIFEKLEKMGILERAY